jgi:aspartyl-tRNA(Asn)/glutamyl-tRNA(Gln) amidotransferase subunit A
MLIYTEQLMNPSKSAGELTALSLCEAARRVREGRVSPVELTQACLARIEELDSTLHAFIAVTAESALQESRAAEAEIRGGHFRGLLHGIPIALKDLVDVAGVPTTAASRLFRDRRPAEDAEIVRRLRTAGAVLIGKTNLHEFAYGGSSVISAYGEVHNPRAPERITGGSSGGSAAAVAAGMCYAAIGTDTGGSIRQPAALCGIVGLKPTYGLVSVRGIVPLSWTLDHAGPMARTVADVAAVLTAIAGYDSQDLNSQEFPATDYLAALDRDVHGLRLGIVREHFFAGLDPEIAGRVNPAITQLERMTSGSCEVTVPIDTDRAVHAAEAWTYHREFVERTPELYHPETLRRIQSGADITAADYIRGRQRVQSLRRTTAEMFRTADVLVTPTVPAPTPKISELLADLDQLRPRELVLLRNTRPFNVLGLPTITVPCGCTSSGLPVGLQLTAAAGAEANLLALANAWERIGLSGDRNIR